MRRWLGLVAGALPLAFAQPAAADWAKFESPNFIVYSDAHPSSVKRQVETLELFDTLLRSKQGIDSKEPVRRKLPIYLLAESRDIRRITPSMNRNVAGFYTAGPDDIYAVADFQRNDMQTLQHEYVHHFMLARFPYGYPAWLIEGYAEYFMTFSWNGEVMEVGDYNRNRAAWLMYEGWLPFTTLLKSRPSELQTDEQVAMYYAQAWALTHYMMSDPARQKQLDAYIRAVGGGADPVAAMEKVTGQSVGTFTSTLRKYLKKFPYQKIVLPDLKMPQVTVTPLPSGIGPVLLITQRLKSDNGQDAPDDKTDGPVLLADARAAAARLPGVREAELLQARAEVKLGDVAVAERILEARLARDPQDVETLQIAAFAKIKTAQDAPAERRSKLLAEARSLAGRAHKADPDSYQTLIAFIQAREGAPGYPNANDLNVLRDALDLAPQVDELRLAASRGLMEASEFKLAADVLKPVAFDPHGGESVTKAKELIAMLEGLEAAKPTKTAAASNEAPPAGE